MDVEIAALCEAATEGPRGKLNILGTFDTISAPRFPFAYPHCALAFRIRFSRIEEGNHRIRVNFVDADGKAIIPSLNANIMIKMDPSRDSAVANLVLHINMLKFQKEGRYSIDMAIDGRHEKSLPLSIAKPEPSS